MCETTLPDGLDIRERDYRDFSSHNDSIRLKRHENGKDVVLELNGETHLISRVASAFPISASEEVVVFFDAEGEEIGMLQDPEGLEEQSRELLQHELERSYFMPRILEIEDMAEELGVESWTVVTNKGKRTFEIRAPRRNVRKVGDNRVIIKDVDANRYEIEDWTRLDRNSLRLLMRHL
ncbi:MAG: DUF1854 domain-containing protein [Planctomycetota bacterium]